MILQNYIALFCVLLSLEKINGKLTAVHQLENKKSVDFVFNLATSKPSSQANGNTIRPLNVNTFPILANMGISYTLFELSPCGINLPHIHPRATELLYV
jgi:hypothetical protein